MGCRLAIFAWGWSHQYQSNDKQANQSAGSSLSVIYHATCNNHESAKHGHSFQRDIEKKPFLFGVHVRVQPFPGIVHFYWDLQVCTLRGVKGMGWGQKQKLKEKKQRGQRTQRKGWGGAENTVEQQETGVRRRRKPTADTGANSS